MKPARRPAPYPADHRHLDPLVGWHALAQKVGAERNRARWARKSGGRRR